jgi:hypothetical protein
MDNAEIQNVKMNMDALAHNSIWLAGHTHGKNACQGCRTCKGVKIQIRNTIERLKILFGR